MWLENVLSSRASYPVKALGRAGIFSNLRDKFDVDTETIDSQWTSKAHKLERNWLIEDLQELAAEKSVRITILGYVYASFNNNAILTLLSQRRCASRGNRTVLLQPKAADPQR